MFIKKFFEFAKKIFKIQFIQQGIMINLCTPANPRLKYMERTIRWYQRIAGMYQHSVRWYQRISGIYIRMI